MEFLQDVAYGLLPLSTVVMVLLVFTDMTKFHWAHRLGFTLMAAGMVWQTAQPAPPALTPQLALVLLGIHTICMSVVVRYLKQRHAPKNLKSLGPK